MSADEHVMDYAAIDSKWREVGLTGLVLRTPGHENAVAAVTRVWHDAGKYGPPMGPVSSSTWPNWIHVVSHCLIDGHGLENRKCQQDLQTLVIDALAEAPTLSA